MPFEPFLFEFSRLLLALLLPTAAGCAWLLPRVTPRRPGTWPMWLGYGHVLGLLFTVVLLLLVDALGLHLSFPLVGGLLLLVILTGWFVRSRASRSSTTETRYSPWPEPRWLRLLGLLLLILLLVRFIGFALEIVWRPLFPWDAWMNWAPKAKVWFEHRSLVPFVSTGQWLQQTDPEVYTLGAWHYPPLVPLLQLWPALALDRWDESLINLPWLSGGLALGLGFYGQLRLLGAGFGYALLFTYLLLSLPILDAHIVLAGYAELWVVIFYLLATLALLRWFRERDPLQGLLALSLALALPLIKVPGLVWLLSFLPALAVLLLPLRWLLAAGGMVLLLVLWFLVFGGQFELPGIGTVILTTEQIRVPYLIDTRLDYRPAVWAALGKHLGMYANWHLLGYLTPLALLWILLTRPRDRAVWAISTLLATGLLALGLVFFFSYRADWIIDGTTTNRALLHVLPLVVILLALMSRTVFRPASAATSETPSSA